jgi:hypothetical protein
VKLHLEVFQSALKIMGENVELTEVACIAANLIDKVRKNIVDIRHYVSQLSISRDLLMDIYHKNIII